MENKRYNVLFLCTGNSARSIIAEALLKRWGMGKFNAYSAGSMPKGRLHPMTERILRMNNFNPDDFRSKSRDEFSGSGALLLDFVFTVCDRAAREVCPVWPGQPMSAHWGIADPDQEFKTEEELWRKFKITYSELDNRIKIFTSLPIEGLDKLSLQKKLDEIGRKFTEEYQLGDKSA